MEVKITGSPEEIADMIQILQNRLVVKEPESGMLIPDSHNHYRVMNLVDWRVPVPNELKYQNLFDPQPKT